MHRLHFTLHKEYTLMVEHDTIFQSRIAAMTGLHSPMHKDYLPMQGRYLAMHGPHLLFHGEHFALHRLYFSVHKLHLSMQRMSFTFLPPALGFFKERTRFCPVAFSVLTTVYPVSASGVSYACLTVELCKFWN